MALMSLALPIANSAIFSVPSLHHHHPIHIMFWKQQKSHDRFSHLTLFLPCRAARKNIVYSILTWYWNKLKYIFWWLTRKHKHTWYSCRVSIGNRFAMSHQLIEEMRFMLSILNWPNVSQIKEQSLEALLTIQLYLLIDSECLFGPYFYIYWFLLNTNYNFFIQSSFGLDTFLPFSCMLPLPATILVNL